MLLIDYVEINLPEAKDVADLSGIKMDFNLARRYAVQLQEIFEKTPQDFTYVDSLSIAILIQYNRPFAEGWRTKLTLEIIGRLSAELISLHQHYKAWRDKHVAHSVNSFENNKAVARYRIDKFEEEGFYSIDSIGDRVVGLGYQDVLQIINLIDALSPLIEEEIEFQKKKLLEIVRSHPKEQILAMGKGSPTPYQEGDIKRRRKW